VVVKRGQICGTHASNYYGGNQQATNNGPNYHEAWQSQSTFSPVFREEGGQEKQFT